MRAPILPCLLVLAACASSSDDASQGADLIENADVAVVVKNGESQPVYPYAQAIRESVFVESTIDSDHDGVLDRIAVDIIRPNTDRKVAIVMEASPYYRMGALTREMVLPLGQRSWYDEFFVPRGYAVVEVEMQGTARSKGCPMTGGKEDTASIKAAIDWLNGRARGFDANGAEVAATWSTGSVGMLGVSYNGTLPIAVASEGVPGLKTIVPIAAISSWYDYTRDAGVGYSGVFGKRYPAYLAGAVVSRDQKPKCEQTIQQIGDAAGDDTYDYTRFWEERDYRRNLDRITASVFVVHGLRDWNVKPHNFSRLWYGLAARNVPRKIWIHNQGHANPASLRPAEWKAEMHHWMDHWLYGIENGVMNGPRAMIQRPDRTWEAHTDWPEASPQTFVPSGAALSAAPARAPEEQSFTDDPSLSEATLIAAPDTTKPYRLAWVGPTLAAPMRVSGTVHLHVAARASTSSTPLTALLVDYGPATIALPEDFTAAELFGRSCRLIDLEQRTGCAAPQAPREITARENVVTRGAVDLKNQGTIAASAPLIPGTMYEVDWDLHPTDYVFAAGHRVGIVLVANDNSYITVDQGAGGITVKLDQTRFVLPVSP
jgi:X-Pro dipeptidyl-peptidase